MMFKKIVLFLLIVPTRPDGLWAQGTAPDSQQSQGPVGLYSEKIDHLSTFGKFDTSRLQGHQAVWVLFQPDCRSCESQLRNLDCLPGDVQKIAVGIWGSRKALQDTIRFTKFLGEKLMADGRFEKIVQPQQTPTIVITDPNGNVKQKLTSLVKCIELKKYLKQKKENP